MCKNLLDGQVSIFEVESEGQTWASSDLSFRPQKFFRDLIAGGWKVEAAADEFGLGLGAAHVRPAAENVLQLCR